MKKVTKFFLIFVFILILTQAATVFAATITVNSAADNSTGGNGLCTLREAIANANADADGTGGDCAAGAGADTILFDSGYTITLGSQLPAVSTDITINGTGGVTISGGGTIRPLAVNTGGSLNLQALVLDSGFSNAGNLDGGAVFVQAGASLSTNGVTFSNNLAADSGGAIRTDGTATINSTTFTSNQANTVAGAIYVNGGTLSITGSSFGTNQAPTAGAIAVNAGDLTVSGSSFTGNFSTAAAGDGGAVYLTGGGTHSFTNTTFDNNYAEDNGGALNVVNGTVTITDSIFQNHNNAAIDAGGAIEIIGGSVTITGGTFSNNQATLDGGAVRVNMVGTLSIDGTAFSSNSANDGGAVYHSAPTLLTVSNATFSGNQANVSTDSDGGAVFLAGGTSATISGSTFSNNSAREDGGAISTTASPFTLTGSTFTGNSADGEIAPGYGGAVYLTEASASVSPPVITLSTFLNNSVDVAADIPAVGGAIGNDTNGLVIANVTFSGNSANNNSGGTVGALGGALFTSSDDSVTVYNATFSGNSVSGGTTPAGGNVYNLGVGSTTTLANTIVANGAPGNCGGTITDGGNNIDFNGGNNCGAGFSNGDPELGALTGSPAYFPIAITLTNAALDAGNNAVCANAVVNNQSQNGLTRPVDGDNSGTAECDIGSYESPADTTAPDVTINQTATQADPTNASPINFTVIFSEPVLGFATGDVTLDGTAGATTGTVTEIAPNDGTTYNVAVSGMTGDGTVIATIAAGVATDLIGNDNNASTSTDNTVTYDTTGPTVTIDQESTQADPTNASPINFTVVFSEPVADFATGDVSLSGTAGATTGTVTEIAPNDGTTYNVAVSGMTVDGTVIADILAGVATDAAGNSNEASTSTDNTVTYDTTGPTVTIDQESTQADPTNASPINFTVVFSEPVADFATGDVTLSGTAGATTGTVTEIAPNDGTTYNVAVSGMTVDGTVIADILTGVATDAAGNSNEASTSTDNVVTYDATAPTVTVDQESTQADPTSASPINFTVVFSEPVADFATGDVSLSGTAGATTAVVTGSGTTYNVAVSGMTGDGTVIADILAGVATDAAGNLNEASTSTDNVVTYDTTGPTVTVDQESTQADPTNASPIYFTVVFSEPVADFATGDVTLSGTAGATTGTVTEIAPNDGTTYNVAVSGMTGDGTVIATVEAGVASDSLGNLNSASTSTDNTVTYDTAGPTVTVDQESTQADPTNASPINFTVVFSEPVADFATGDVTLSGTAGATTGTVTEIAPNDGTTYNVAVSGMTADGTVIATVAAGVASDAGGNPNGASTSTDNTVTYDTTGPTVTVEQEATQADPTNASPINFTVVFSEPVADFATGDVTLSGTAGATTGTVTEIAPNDGTTYNVAVSGMTGDGTVIADILAGVATDAAGNSNEASTSTDNVVTYDTAGPTVTVDQAAAQADPTNASPINFTVVFSEPVADFATGDVTLSGTAGATTGTVTEIAPNDGTTYNVAVSGMTGDGTVIATVAADVATDAAGNSNTASTSTDNVVTYDTTGPTVTIDQAAAQADPTNASPINFTVVFSEPVADFATGDVTLSGTAGATTGTVTEIAPNDGTTYNVAVSGMTGDGTVIATVAAGVATDAGGNSNEASTSTDNVVTYDTTGPTVTIDQAAAQADPTNASPINFTVVFSEPMTGFTTGDVTLSGTAGATTGTVTEIAPNDGTTYNVAVSGMTGDGTVIATIAAGVASDPGGNPNGASTSTDNTVTYDTTPPTPVITGPSSPTASDPFTITIDFGEPVVGFDGSDITVGNGNVVLPITDEGGGLFTVVINAAADGLVTVDVAAAVAQDEAGNDNLVAEQFSVEVDTSLGTVLPQTGFPQGKVTDLSIQPESAAYANTEMQLKIPALGLSMPIVGVPLVDEIWDVSWLDDSAGYLEGSAFPTWEGNTVLTGHVWDANNLPGPFIHLKNLKYGDRIEIEAWGMTYVYEVRESRLVWPSDVGTVFQHEEYDWVTLVTCEDYRMMFENYSFRRVVRAVLVDVN